MKPIIRALIVIFVIYAAVMAIMGLQYLFDRGDMKKAAKVIYQYKPSKKQDITLVQLMAQQLGISQEHLYCETQLISRYEGHVLVECGTKQNFLPENSELNYQWMVDIVGGSIDGKNGKAKKLIIGLVKE